MILDGTLHYFTSERPVEETRTNLKGYICPVCGGIYTYLDTYTDKIVCKRCMFTSYENMFSFEKDIKK